MLILIIPPSKLFFPVSQHNLHFSHKPQMVHHPQLLEAQFHNLRILLFSFRQHVLLEPLKLTRVSIAHGERSMNSCYGAPQGSF